MCARMKNIAVIGAGIAGITTAYNLAKRGFRVTVFDQQQYPAMETSFANGGQLSASNAEVWNRWTTVAKGLKWIFTPGAPLLVNPAPTWHKISWMAEFLASIPKYEENTITTARLAVEARAHLNKMAADEGIEFNCERRGILHIYYTKTEFEEAARVSKLLERGGVVRKATTPEEIRWIEPTLQGKYYGGFFTESDLTGDIHLFTNGLARACERLGVSMRFGTAVTNIAAGETTVTIGSRPTRRSVDDQATVITETVSFDQVVICAGVMSRELAKLVGDRVNVYPVKGYSITVNLLEKSDQDAAPWISLLDDRAKIVTSRLGENRFRVAGTAEFTGINRDIKFARIEPLVSWCHANFPAMSTRQVIPWAGLRPMMPDMLPRVMRGKNARILYNTGHGHLGWTLAAATADAVGVLAMANSNSY